MSAPRCGTLLLMMGSDPYTATITAREQLADSLAVFRVRPDADPRPFTPGQYLTLGRMSGTRLVQRAYSVASSARRVIDGYELYIRLIPGGALTPLLFSTGPGDRVSLRWPKGRFTLRADERDDLHLFVATGCGIAPFMSMLRTLRDDGERRQVVLLHGVSYAQELAYRDELASWSAGSGELTYLPTISRPAATENDGWAGLAGRVEHVLADVCARHRIEASGAVAYVCGNPEMTAAVEGILRSRGFPEQRIRTEDYWPLAR